MHVQLWPPAFPTLLAIEGLLPSNVILKQVATPPARHTGQVFGVVLIRIERRS